MNDKSPLIELGALLAQARIQKGWTQKELAFRTGYSQSYIDKIEKGKQRGSFNALSKIATLLGLPPELVLKQAALANIGFIPFEDTPFEYSLEDFQFRQLEPRLKRLLLTIAREITEYVES